MKLTGKQCMATIAACSMLAACNNSSSGGFDTDTATGVQYHFFNHDDKGTKPSIGDYAEVLLTLKNANDSVIYDPHHKRKTDDTSLTMKLHLKNTFAGCLAQGITLMAAGDSANFRVNADSVYLKTFHSQTLPPYIKPGSFVTFSIKLVDFQTPQQMSDDLDKQLKERAAMTEKRKVDEQSVIQKYLTDSNVKAKPESNGAYILARTKGKGKPIKESDSVEVKYSCWLLDGAMAETSDLGPGKNTFTLIYGKDHFVKGFDDIIANLENGGRVKALLPSSLVYGEQMQSHLILPYTPLIYDVEIISVK